MNIYMCIYTLNPVESNYRDCPMGHKICFSPAMFGSNTCSTMTNVWIVFHTASYLEHTCIYLHVSKFKWFSYTLISNHCASSILNEIMNCPSYTCMFVHVYIWQILLSKNVIQLYIIKNLKKMAVWFEMVMKVTWKSWLSCYTMYMYI